MSENLRTTALGIGLGAGVTAAAGSAYLALAGWLGGAGPWLVSLGAGAVAGALGAALHCARRRLAREAAARAESESRSRLIMDTAPALLSYVDAEGRYRFNNHAYETWFGHPRHEVTGRHMRDVLGEAAWAVVGPKIEAAL